MPPVTAVAASPGFRIGHTSIRPWKPAKSDILTVTYNYLPLDCPRNGKQHIVHLLTKDGQVAAIIRYKAQ